MQILTVEEVQKLFHQNYRTVWGNKKLAYVACRLASLTGMKIREILRLRGEYVFVDYINVLRG
jgi:integrase